MSTAMQVQGPKSLELREEHLALAPVMDMKEAKKALDELSKFVREQLVEGTGPDADYGKIPGTNKPSLYQPGAQKIAFYFGLTPVPKLEREVMTAEFCSKTYTVTMVDRRSGRDVAACSGSCNSTESRFFKKGKAVYVDARETENTCDKMAQKRALVGATIIATRAAGLFTQDVEDLPKQALGQDGEAGEEVREEFIGFPYPGDHRGKRLSTKKDDGSDYLFSTETIQGTIGYAQKKIAKGAQNPALLQQYIAEAQAELARRLAPKGDARDVIIGDVAEQRGRMPRETA